MLSFSPKVRKLQIFFPLKLIDVLRENTWKENVGPKIVFIYLRLLKQQAHAILTFAYLLTQICFCYEEKSSRFLSFRGLYFSDFEHLCSLSTEISHELTRVYCVHDVITCSPRQLRLLVGNSLSLQQYLFYFQSFLTLQQYFLACFSRRIFFYLISVHIPFFRYLVPIPNRLLSADLPHCFKIWRDNVSCILWRNA